MNAERAGRNKVQCFISVFPLFYVKGKRIMWKKLWMLLVLLIGIPAYILAVGAVTPGGYCRGIYLAGKVKVVPYHGDLRVKVVGAFPDLRVQRVRSFPQHVGEWQYVEYGQDFTIQYVEVFPDLRIQFVRAFPGVV